MRRVSRRPERVAELLRKTIAPYLQSSTGDPRLGFLTVTGVEVTRDLGYATIRVSVLGEEAEKKRALQGLNSARGHLRSLLARKLHLRQVPDLRFSLDRGLEHAHRVNAILSSLKQTEERG